jgi:hypothetical protein
MMRINIAGYASCGYYMRAKNALVGLASIFPNKISAEVMERKCCIHPSSLVFRRSLGAF